METVTDAQGRFAFRTISPGEYVIEAHFADFMVVQEALSVGLGGHQEVNLSFAGSGDELPEPADGGIREIYWNSWLGDHDRPPRQVARLVADGTRYTVLFHLSQFLYEAMGGSSAADAPLDPALLGALEEAARDEKSTFLFKVFPIVGGTGLRLARRWTAGAEVEVELDRLTEPLAPRQSKETFEEFAGRVAAAEVAVEVFTAETPGCATLGLSIWSTEVKPRPLDHVILRIPVSPIEGPDPTCEPLAGGKTFSADLVQALNSEHGAPVDAAFHVFGEDPALALFVASETEHWGWPLKREVAWLAKSSGLERELALSRDKQDYAPAISRLTSMLFPPDEDEAQEALTHLRDLASAADPPVVLARIVDERGLPLTIPLGLLDNGARGALGEAIDMLVPMPADRWSLPAGCLATWDFVLPSSLQTQRGARLGSCNAPMPSSGFGENWNLFGDWMRTTRPDPQGVLLLAHHDPEAGISFEVRPDAPRALPEDLTREFAAGSAAVLVTCHGATLSSRYDTWIATLNAKRIDGAVVSAFSVDVGLGACFARYMANAIETAHEEISFRELLRRTRRDLSKDLPPGAAAAVHEFILVGNPEIRVCARSEE